MADDNCKIKVWLPRRFSVTFNLVIFCFRLQQKFTGGGELARPSARPTAMVS